jgi:ABC-2 type transport system permease protein
MRTRAIILRIVRQFIHDKRTMFLMFIPPIFILSLMGLVFNGDVYEPKIGVSGVSLNMAVSLKEQHAVVTEYATPELGKTALIAGEIDALITLDKNTANLDGIPDVLLEGSNPTASQAVIMTLQQISQKLLPNAEKQMQLQPQINYLYGSADMKTIDRFGPVMIGIFVFFFVFLIAGVSFWRERTTGTLERLLSTPLKRWEIVLGYVCGFGIFTVFQALLISWYSIQILGIIMMGSFLYVMLITLLLSMTAMTLGTLLSTVAANELQLIQFIPLIIAPQIFLSGLFPLDTLPVGLQRLGAVTPIYYGSQALMDIMVRGKGWSAIALNVFVLIGFSLLFMILNVLALRKHLKRTPVLLL